MNEPNTRIKLDRDRHVYIPAGEEIIVTPERAAALKPFLAAPPAEPPVVQDRMMRSRRTRTATE